MVQFNYNNIMIKRVYLEITNSCNLNCPFCTNEKGNVFMSLEDIDNYLSQIKKQCDYIYLHILGEPTLHPNFEEILNLCDKYELKLQLVTNGTLLYKYPNLLTHKCLRKLSISLHSINNTGIDKKYFDSINNLIDENKETKLELRFYDKENLSPELNNYLHSLKTSFSFEVTAKENSYKLKDNTYVYFNELFNWPNINDKYISNVGTCRGAIDMIAINSNSDVTICCLDPKAYNKIGNLKENTLESILNSDKYLNYVEEFKNNKIKSDLCSKCTYRLRF